MTREPDERAFRKHVGEPRFQSGVDRGDWRIVLKNWIWPHPIIAVSAAPREGAPDEVALRFTVDGYPEAAPTAVPWNTEGNTILPHEMWPTGGRVGAAFNPQWNGGNAIYIPCDRLAIEGHSAWLNQHRAYVWDSGKQIVDYLRIVHELLNSIGYTGIRGAS